MPWIVTLHIFNHLVTVRTPELNVASTTFINRLVGSPVAVDLPAKEQILAQAAAWLRSGNRH